MIQVKKNRRQSHPLIALPPTVSTLSSLSPFYYMLGMFYIHDPTHSYAFISCFINYTFFHYIHY